MSTMSDLHADMIESGWTLAADLTTGDRFQQRRYNPATESDDLIVIEVLRSSESASDPFGRDGHFKFWCKRTDTGQEGYMTYGPAGMVEPA